MLTPDEEAARAQKKADRKASRRAANKANKRLKKNRTGMEETGSTSEFRNEVSLNVPGSTLPGPSKRARVNLIVGDTRKSHIQSNLTTLLCTPRETIGTSTSTTVSQQWVQEDVIRAYRARYPSSDATDTEVFNMSEAHAIVNVDRGF
ncbi:hypothetical protein PQX77_002005 [Marasmius sp. AFHP31]|nr:hypothetical protein PQX77_002005 [Marasmius sp. AFHP31]